MSTEKRISREMIGGAASGAMSYPLLTSRDKWSVSGLIRATVVGAGTGVVAGEAVNAVY